MRKKNILVIDDDDMNLQIARMILERKLPCKVFGAESGLDGIEILHKQRVDLVLLDVLMPNFDGIETLQEIRDDEQIKDVPVMMLTATVEKETIQAARELGAIEYIKKPFMPADLVARVSKKLAEINSEEILLFGDDLETLKNMQAVIEENFPHEAIIAANLDDAIKILREQEINLVVTCADMKFIDGFKLLNFLAHEEKFSEVPFAVTTPEKLREVIDKLTPPDEPAEVEKSAAEPAKPADKPAEPARTDEFVTLHAEKKQVANVVTNLIGYELDLHV